jgi:hypothetical protein
MAIGFVLIIMSHYVGRSITLLANFFKIKPVASGSGEVVVYHYHVDIVPAMPQHINKQIFKKSIPSVTDKPDGVVYDGICNVFSSHKLDFQSAFRKGSDIDVLADTDSLADTDALAYIDALAADATSRVHVIVDGRMRTFNIDIVEKKTLTIRLGDELISSKSQLAALDIICRHTPSTTFSSVGKHFFLAEHVKNLGYGAECFMGFFQNIHFSLQKPMLNIDVSAKAFYEPCSLIIFITHFLHKRGPTEITSPLKSYEIEKLETLLLGLRIKLAHSGAVFKIRGLTTTPVSETYFSYRSVSAVETEWSHATVSVRCNVEDYYKIKYNTTLKFPFLPCVVGGSKENPVYFPIELGTLLPGQKYSQKLNEFQTSSMIRLTCQTPKSRMDNIANAIYALGMKNCKNEDALTLQNFGLTVDQNMLRVSARILPTPTLQYNLSSREHLVTPVNGSWNLRDKKILHSAGLTHWAILSFSNQYDLPPQKLAYFRDELISTCLSTGLNITNHHPVLTYANPHVDLRQTINEIMSKTPLQLLVCILNNTNSQSYSQIKHLGDTVFGIPTQCVQLKNALQPKKQFCANVCLKMNVKLGGLNTLLSHVNVHSEIFKDNIPTMIFGADMSYPLHKDSSVTQTVCSVVGSIDKTYTRFSSAVSLQSPKLHHIQNLQAMTVELLQSFVGSNRGILPQRVVFYRNGITENQIEHNCRLEIADIKKACLQISPGYSPNITFAVVQRHHHVRLFTTNRNDADKYGNIPAGTVIDSHITKPDQYDFYLCSHAGLQGTSRPSYYQIIHDENRFEPHLLQQFTYQLCYTYSRCTRSVSIVPPVYYAGLVAIRTKFHIKGDVECAGAGAGHGVGVGGFIPRVTPGLYNTMYFV